MVEKRMLRFYYQPIHSRRGTRFTSGRSIGITVITPVGAAWLAATHLDEDRAGVVRVDEGLSRSQLTQLQDTNDIYVSITIHYREIYAVMKWKYVRNYRRWSVLENIFTFFLISLSIFHQHFQNKVISIGDFFVFSSWKISDFGSLVISLHFQREWQNLCLAGFQSSKPPRKSLLKRAFLSCVLLVS